MDFFGGVESNNQSLHVTYEVQVQSFTRVKITKNLVPSLREKCFEKKTISSQVYLINEYGKMVMPYSLASVKWQLSLRHQTHWGHFDTNRIVLGLKSIEQIQWSPIILEYVLNQPQMKTIPMIFWKELKCVQRQSSFEDMAQQTLLENLSIPRTMIF